MLTYRRLRRTVYFQQHDVRQFRKLSMQRHLQLRQNMELMSASGVTMATSCHKIVHRRMQYVYQTVLGVNWTLAAQVINLTGFVCSRRSVVMATNKIVKVGLYVRILV